MAHTCHMSMCQEYQIMLRKQKELDAAAARARDSRDSGTPGSGSMPAGVDIVKKEDQRGKPHNKPPLMMVY